jgi:hypothetical protein
MRPKQLPSLSVGDVAQVRSEMVEERCHSMSSVKSFAFGSKSVEISLEGIAGMRSIPYGS